jgi:hypothetical protein
VDTELSINKKDNTHNIKVEHCPSSTMAAYASPSPFIDAEGKEHGSIIGDCDIVICDNNFTAQFLASTLTHELGHCVGLGHPHSSYKSIMSYARSDDSYKLDTDDKAGAIYLYPDPQYADVESKELIGCGSINAQTSTKPTKISLITILGLPIMVMSLRRLRKMAQF